VLESSVAGTWHANVTRTSIISHHFNTQARTLHHAVPDTVVSITAFLKPDLAVNCVTGRDASMML
jgi:hypothetical protein